MELDVDGLSGLVVLSGLKTLLEKAEQLDTPGSLMYADNGADRTRTERHDEAA